MKKVDEEIEGQMNKADGSAPKEKEIRKFSI